MYLFIVFITGILGMLKVRLSPTVRRLFLLGLFSQNGGWLLNLMGPNGIIPPSPCQPMLSMAGH